MLVRVLAEARMLPLFVVTLCWTPRRDNGPEPNDTGMVALEER